MKRRTFLRAGIAGAVVGAIAAPNIARAEKTFKWRMTTSFPPGLPFYQSGPGSAEWIVKAIDEASNGRLKIKLFAAGELVKWNGGFDAVTGGNDVVILHLKVFSARAMLGAAMAPTTAPATPALKNVRRFMMVPPCV